MCVHVCVSVSVSVYVCVYVCTCMRACVSVSVVCVYVRLSVISLFFTTPEIIIIIMILY